MEKLHVLQIMRDSVVVGMHHAMNVHHISSSVSCPVIQYFCSHYLTTGRNFDGENLLNIKRVSSFSKIFSEKIFSHRVNGRNMIENAYCFYVNCPLFLSHFHET